MWEDTRLPICHISLFLISFSSRINRGRKTALIASRNISPGQEITDIYSMHYSEISLAQRKSWLKDMFFFECRCQACLDDFPVYNSLPSTIGESLGRKLKVLVGFLRCAVVKAQQYRGVFVIVFFAGLGRDVETCLSAREVRGRPSDTLSGCCIDGIRRTRTTSTLRIDKEQHAIMLMEDVCRVIKGFHAKCKPFDEATSMPSPVEIV